MLTKWTAALSIALGTVIGSQGEVLYHEDFEHGYPTGITTVGAWSIGQPGLGSSSAGFAAIGSQVAFWLNDIPSDDVTVDVDFRIATQSWGDFDVFLNSDMQHWPTRGYDIEVNPHASDNPMATINKFGAPGICLASTVNTILAGQEHHLRVQRAGASISVFQDDMQSVFLAASDATWNGGAIGFRLAGGGMVDNIVVSVPEPCALVLLAVALLLRPR
jgi:hypothetical protein